MYKVKNSMYNAVARGWAKCLPARQGLRWNCVRVEARMRNWRQTTSEQQNVSCRAEEGQKEKEYLFLRPKFNDV